MDMSRLQMNQFKSSSSKLAIRSGGAYMLSNLLLNGTAILTAPIFSRLLTTADYGVVSNFMAWQSIGLIVIGLGLVYSIGNARLDFPLEFNQFLASIQTLSSITGVFILVISYIFVDFLASVMNLNGYLVNFIFIYLLFLPSVIYAQEKYKFQLDYKKNIAISIVNTIGSILFCLLLITSMDVENRFIGRILGLTIPMFLMGVYFYYSILKDGWNTKMIYYWKYALRISLPFIPHTLGMVVLTQLDRIMIIKLVGNSAAGLYSFGFSYAIIVSLFSNAISQAFQPWLYENYKNENFNQIRSVTNDVILGLSIIMILLISIGPEVIQILGPQNFWGSKSVIMPIVIGSFFQYLAATYSTIQLYYKKTVFIPVGTIIAASVNIVLNLLLIPIYGFTGAAFATLFSFVCLAVFHLIVYKKICKNHIYDDKYMWMVILFSAMLSLLMFLTYDLVLLRYGLLIAYLMFMILIQRKKVGVLLNLAKEKALSKAIFFI
jgi:O-antigen/teichoic acid export membrane protein